jgi:DNA-binding Xre family transcriptional regulator
MSKKIYTKQLFEDDNGDYFMDLGEICEELGWKVGDTLVWSDNGDGSWSLAKFTQEQVG